MGEFLILPGPVSLICKKGEIFHKTVKKIKCVFANIAPQDQTVKSYFRLVVLMYFLSKYVFPAYCKQTII